MDFFEHQDRARRQTRRLIVLFILGVIAVVACTTAAVWVVLELANPATDAAIGASDANVDRPFDASQAARDPMILGGVALATLLLILGGSAFRILQIGGDGAGVAAQLGGRPIDHDTTDLDERRLLNVVEEMAIASGTPVPPVYVMDDEMAINAFAAGTSPETAVIGVTRGTIKHLKRDELQGVIGHEFSHILSGDMKLNIRLIGVLAGILILGHIGQLMLRSSFYAGAATRRSSRNRGGGGAMIAILLLGGALMAIGFVGAFFGSWIKSAVSRQREYLADAAAVQFTRDRNGIAGALKKIGGFRRRSLVRAPNADECSHMFFGKGVSSIFATHPPLLKRIQALDPSWDGEFTRIEDTPAPKAAEKPEREPPRIAADRFAHAVALSATAMIGQPTRDHLAYAASLYGSIPEAARKMAGDPFSARAVACALLLSRFKETQRVQLEAVREIGGEPLVAELKKAAPLVGRLDASLRLPLVELLAPSLRRLSEPQAERMAGLIDRLVDADNTLDLYEWCVSRMLKRPLLGEPGRLGALHYSNRGVATEAEKLLGWLAHAGHSSLQEANQAYALGAERFGIDIELTARGDRTVAELDEAIAALRRSSPKVQRSLIHACATVISFDRTVTPQEAELFRAIAESLGVPTPPVLPGQPLV
jgi:Zn-dependent protease with chaperone function